MATMDFSSYSIFQQTGGTNYIQVHSNNAAGVLDDNEGDTTFEANEDIILTSSTDYTYIGTVSVTDGTSGDTYDAVVSQSADGTGLFVVSPAPYLLSAATDFPGSINTTTLNTADLVVCFGAGTQIATPTGEVRVETLAIGDLIRSASGQDIAVKWIGRQTVKTMFGPTLHRMPVRFDAGSLDAGVPHSDLTVTADHGMFVDGVVCNAGALVNGTSITRVPPAEMGETYTVYHIETDTQDIILANGATSETFIDNVSRRRFDNFAEFEALYGEVPEMTSLPYARAMSVRQVPRHIKARLNRRVAA